MTVEIVSDDRELLLLQPEWDALWASVDEPCYFQSFSYIQACWEAMYKHKRGLLQCVVVRQSGSVVLLWPLMVTRIAFLRVLKPLNAGASEYTQPLVKDGPEAGAICALAWSAARSRIKSDIISMPLVKEGSCLHDVLSREKPFSVEKDTCYVQKGGDTWKDWDTYYKAVTAGHNLKSEKKRRRLGEQGTLGFETLEQSGDAAAMIDWCLRQKREWAERGNKRGAWLYSPEFRSFLVALLTGGRSAQSYLIFLLTLDGSPIAAKIAAYNVAKVEGILSCFDAEWAKYSPGSVLDECFARWLVERSMECDFGVGSEEYKKLWSYNNVIAVAGYKFPGSLLGRLALWARQWWRSRRKQQRDSISGRTHVASSIFGEPAGVLLRQMPSREPGRPSVASDTSIAKASLP